MPGSSMVSTLTRRPGLLALLLFVATLALSAPSWVLPLQRDQGVYAACGSFLAQGQLPYVSCWDTKGPLTHATYTLAQWVFGVSLHGPHILNALWAAATGLLLTLVARRWWPVDSPAPLRWGWLAAIYAGLLVTFPFDMNAQTEGFANLPLLLGLLLLLRAVDQPDQRHWLYFAGGALLGFAGLYKYTLLLVGAVIGGLCWLTLPNDPRRDWRGWLTLAGLGALGTLVVWGIFLFSLAIVGAMPLMIEHVQFMLTEFPKVQVNPVLLLFPGESGPPLFYWQRTLRELLRLPVIYLGGIAGLLWALTQPTQRRIALLLWGWAAVAMFTVFAQRVFTLYHWMLLLPPMLFGLALLAQALSRQRWALPVLLIALSVNIGWRFYADTWTLVGPYLAGQMTYDELLDSQAVADELEIARYIADRTTPDDLIYVWGNHSIIYYMAERRAPTRFIFNSPLMARIGENDFQPRWLDEVLAALYANPPTYLVVTWYDMTWFDYITPVEQVAAMPGYQHLLDTYYPRETFIGRFAIHRLTPWHSRSANPELVEYATVLDLIDAFPSAQAQPAPTIPIELQTYEVPGEPPYPVIFMHPEGRLTYTVAIPTGSPACFRADLAINPQSWGWGSDGVTYALDVNGERVFEYLLGNTPTDQRWHPILVDLSAYAGQTVALTLSTGPGPGIDFTGDQAGWGQPRIMRAPGPTCAANALIIPGSQPAPRP